MVDQQSKRIQAKQRRSWKLLAAMGKKLGVALVLAMASTQAGAGIIIGDSVDVAVYAPTQTEVCFLCGGTTRVTVTNNARDAVQPYFPGDDWFTVDVNSTSISIVFNRDITWQRGEFVGLIISDIDWLDGAVRSIPGAELVIDSVQSMAGGLFENRLSYTDNSVALNWESLSITANTRFEILLQAPAANSGAPRVNVAEPSSLLLLLVMGLIFAGFNLRRPRPLGDFGVS